MDVIKTIGGIMIDKYTFRELDCSEISYMDNGDIILSNAWADRLINGRLDRKAVVNVRIKANVVTEIIRQRILKFLNIN